MSTPEPTGQVVHPTPPGPPPWGVTPEVKPVHHWPPPPPWWWTWPSYVTPPWSNRPGWGTPWAPWCGPGPLPWVTTEWLGAMDPWAGWMSIGGWPWPMDGVQSGPPCRGCQAGWPFDSSGRHVGPAAYPNSNRWDCNRARFLGTWAQAVGAGVMPAPYPQQLYPRWVG